MLDPDQYMQIYLKHGKEAADAAFNGGLKKEDRKLKVAIAVLVAIVIAWVLLP